MDVTASPRSQLRHRPTNVAAQVAPVASRQSLPPEVLGRMRRTIDQNQPISARDQALIDQLSRQTQAYQYPQAPDTYDDDEIAPSTRTTQPARKPRQPKQYKHPAFYIGLTLAGMLASWVATTAGAAWVTTHLSDPGIYGPAHGQVVLVKLEGDQAQPSTIYSANDNGHVLIIRLLADDPSKTQIIPGPDLAKLNIPDPAGAEIAIQAGDFDHDGHQDIEVTINSTTFDTPLHRYSQTYILYGDGKGGLKMRSAQ